MTIETIIIICLIIIFLLLARRLPDVMKRPDVPLTVSKKGSHFFRDEQEIVKRDKSNLEIADDFFKKGNYQEAEKFYVKAATQEPNNPKIYNRLGIIYLEQKNYRDAKDAFEATLKFDSKKASRHINYGLACLNLRNFNEAIKSFEKAIKLEPKNKKYQSLLKEAKNKKKLVEKK